jgi:hypothetical protein
MDNASNLKLIADNWDVLLPAAEHGFEERGRGTVLADTTRLENGGYPIQYLNLAALPDDDSVCGRMVRTYDPQKEVVVSLLRDDGRVYSYQLGRPTQTTLVRRGA